MSWIDSHLHLTHYDSDSDIDKVLTQSIENGAEFFLQGGVNPQDWIRQIEIQKRFRGHVGTCFGLHPWWVDEVDPDTLSRAFDLLTELLPSAMGLGELGLDFGQKTNPEHYPKQEFYFSKQIELTISLDKPLVLHSVNAHQDSLKHLKNKAKQYRGIVHSFSGNIEIANQYIDLGLTLSVGPGLLDQGGFFALKKMIEKVNLEHIVLETDAPDRLASPELIPTIAQAISEIRGQRESAMEILEITTQNFKKVFNIGTQSNA